ncbi:MAG TPA: aminotransferase class III-fold pyridoxal phosphate-dependent enzyme [Planctomycetota bacterium]|nr:aminotransferase class III-fold pyridoxal phosphate-dependent enzyme [Planctomycetota bacterium]
MSLLKTFKTLPLELARGEDVWVWDTAGKKYMDLYAGHAVCSTGHCHPHVVKAVQEQVGKLIFYSNVAAFPLREEAAALLLKHAPAFSAALFANSGAEANENALKLARRHTGRPEIVAMQGGFHGRTAGAISATGIEKYRKQSEPLVPGISFVPFGTLPVLTDRTAAVILEPIQSMAGCRTAPAEYFQKLRELCTKNGTVLIYDEVQTGIGRTGTMFFTGRHGVNADLITLAKAIGSGIPLSAVLASKGIADKVQYGEYGATFGAGPVAMAAMKATLEVVEGLLPNVVEVGRYLAERCEHTSGVKEVRGMGFLLGLKLEGDASAAQKALLERGFIVGTADEPGVIRLLPPLTLTPTQVDSFVKTLGEVLKITPIGAAKP